MRVRPQPTRNTVPHSTVNHSRIRDVKPTVAATRCTACCPLAMYKRSVIIGSDQLRRRVTVADPDRGWQAFRWALMWPVGQWTSPVQPRVTGPGRTVPELAYLPVGNQD